MPFPASPWSPTPLVSVPVNTGNLTSDYLLRPGEIAYVNFVNAASIPLNIKTEEGIYEITLSCPYGYSPTPVIPQLGLRPNNVDQGTAIRAMIWYEGDNSNSIAAYRETTGACHFGCSYKVVSSTMRITTYTNSKTFHADTSDCDSTYRYVSKIRGVWENTTTPWISLGTFVSGNAHTGRVVIRRIM